MLQQNEINMALSIQRVSEVYFKEYSTFSVLT